MLWDCAGFRLDLNTPKIMAVVNLTQDSFSDGGEYLDYANACRRIDTLLEAGADILDIGAESSRPGALPITEDLEWERLKPVLTYAVSQNIPVSVDTCKPVVMKQAIDHGVAIINDIQALSQPEAIDCITRSNVGVCLMHMKGNPQTMQKAPDYVDVRVEVKQFLEQRWMVCLKAGISRSRIVLDPGIGFGKTLDHNIELFQKLPELVPSGVPVLLGVSRKSMIGSLTGQRHPQDRMAGSLAAALYAVKQGVSVLRVHDVRETKDALAVWSALNRVE